MSLTLLLDLDDTSGEVPDNMSGEVPDNMSGDME